MTGTWLKDMTEASRSDSSHEGVTYQRTLASIPFDGVEGGQLPALMMAPPDPLAGCLLAHGAGAGHRHRLMERSAVVLARCGIASLRYDFPYMAEGGRRPDRPKRLHAAVRAATQHARLLFDGIAEGLPMIAGGRSMGGRMTSQAQALEPLPSVRGLVFFAFPLHPVKKPGRERAEHLRTVDIPMLFLAGTRDKLALPEHLHPTIEELGTSVTLSEAVGADHSFEVLKRSGRTPEDVDLELAEAIKAWLGQLL